MLVPQCPMLLHPRRGTEEVQALAEQVGCTVGEWSPAYGRGGVALIGSTAGFTGTLKRFGGRYDPTDNAIVFAQMPYLRAALIQIIDDRKTAEGPPA